MGAYFRDKNAILNVFETKITYLMSFMVFFLKLFCSYLYIKGQFWVFKKFYFMKKCIACWSAYLTLVDPIRPEDFRMSYVCLELWFSCVLVFLSHTFLVSLSLRPVHATWCPLSLTLIHMSALKNSYASICKKYTSFLFHFLNGYSFKYLCLAFQLLIHAVLTRQRIMGREEIENKSHVLGQN